jgi:hypothetical protein
LPMCIAAWELTTTVRRGNLNQRTSSDPSEAIASETPSTDRT